MKKTYHHIPPGFQRNPEFHGKAFNPCKFRPGYSSNHHRKSEFRPNQRLDRPPESFSPIKKPNFVVRLRSGRRSFNKTDVESLIAECKCKPESFSVFPSDHVAAGLNFCQWVDALEAFLCFWELRFNEVHDFTPELISHVLVPSDMDELRGRLRAIFASHVKGLLEGKEVKRWREESERISKELASLTYFLKRPKSIPMNYELREKKKGLDAEKRLIEKRINEFRSGMECILRYLEDSKEEEDGCAVFRKLKFDEALDWKRIDSLIMRERRRLEEGLPIYAYRSDILQEIHSQQVYSLYN